MQQDLFSIDEKVIIITGGGRGIGRELAIALASRGAIVHCIDIAFPNPVQNDLTHNIFDNNCDITNVLQFKTICKEIFEKHGKIDTLINNAGVTFTQEDVKNYPKDQWDRTININLTSAFSCSEAVFEYLVKCNGGSIINITSLNAERAFPNNPAYVASKGGLRMLGKALARDWGIFGIRVNNLAPGYIITDMTKKSYSDEETRKLRQSNIMLNRWGTMRDLVGPCIFLISDASLYITGQDIYVDGGWMANGLQRA